MHASGRLRRSANCVFLLGQERPEIQGAAHAKGAEHGYPDPRSAVLTTALYRKLQMSFFLQIVISGIVGFGLLALWYFFVEFPGVFFLKTRWRLRKLRRELEPVARAVGATTSTGWHSDRKLLLYFFAFPNVQGPMDNEKWWMTLEIDPAGIGNIYLPSFSPPQPRPTELEVLYLAAKRLSTAS